MKTGENIHNAFDVVLETYQNVSKMIEDCLKLSEEYGEFVCITPNFVRYKSDSDYWGWCTKQIFLGFEMNNSNSKNSIYLIDINLYDGYEYYSEPTLELAKFTYDDTSMIKNKLSKRDSYYYLTHPLYDEDLEYEFVKGHDDFVEIDIPEEKKKNYKYLGVKRVVATDMPLVEVTNENLYEKVFGTFIKMEKL